MSDFTPTTAHMREAYAAWRRKWQQDGDNLEEFDRWAHSEFRPWVVSAWDEGYAEGMRQAQQGEASPDNPYRIDPPEAAPDAGDGPA